MSIRRSIAAAVFVAAVSAPTAFGTAQAMAESAPAGQSVPDAAAADAVAWDVAAPDSAVPDTAAPDTAAPDTAAPESAVPETEPAEPAESVLDEAALRARLAAALAEPGHDNVRATRIMHEAGHGTPIWEAARKAFNDGSPEAIEHFLYVTVPALIASDDRVELSQFVEDPIIGAELRAEALGVLEEGDDTAIAAFVQDLPSRLRTDLRLQAVRSMALGPEVRKAANAALNADTVEALRTFLTTGLREAVARDKAAADQATGNGEEGGQADGQPSGGGSGVTQAGLTTATPGTAGTTAAESGTTTTAQLASTGTDAPVGSLVVGGAVAIALGAGTLVAARRRSRES